MRARAASCLLMLLACRASNTAFQLESSSTGEHPHSDRTTSGEPTITPQDQSGTGGGSREGDSESASESPADATDHSELTDSSTATEDEGELDSDEQISAEADTEADTEVHTSATTDATTTGLEDESTDTDTVSTDSAGDTSTTGVDPESSFCDAEDLVACYRFQQVMDGIVLDGGPHANHLSVRGAHITEDDEFGAGLSFHRYASVYATDDPSFALNDGFTIEIWLRLTYEGAGTRADLFDVDGLDVLFQLTEIRRLACGTYQSAGLSLSSVPVESYTYVSCSVSRDLDVVAQIGDAINYGSLRSMPKVEGRNIAVGRDLDAHVLALRVWNRPLLDQERCGKPHPEDCAAGTGEGRKITSNTPAIP